MYGTAGLPPETSELLYRTCRLAGTKRSARRYLCDAVRKIHEEVASLCGVDDVEANDCILDACEDIYAREIPSEKPLDIVGDMDVSNTHASMRRIEMFLAPTEVVKSQEYREDVQSLDSIRQPHASNVGEAAGEMIVDMGSPSHVGRLLGDALETDVRKEMQRQGDVCVGYVNVGEQIQVWDVNRGWRSALVIRNVRGALLLVGFEGWVETADLTTIVWRRAVE